MNAITIPDLSSAAMLVYVRVSVWSARKLDKKQTQKAVKDAKATSDAGRFNKHLLANADAALKEVSRKANQIRDFVDANTLPWDDAGNRLVSNERSLTMVGDLDRMTKEFNATVDAFVAEYPVLRAQAVANLGAMGDDSDYPQPDIVRSKFSVRVTYSPLPSGFGDIRVGMSERQAAAWQAHFESNVQRQMNTALMDAWNRLRENLERYSDRLRIKDDGTGKMEIFRDTMVASLRETIALLSSLNVFKDASLERITLRVSQQVACFEPDALRTSPATAIGVKHEVDAILQQMKDLLG